MPDHNPTQPLPFLHRGVAQAALIVKDLDQTVKNYHKHFGVGSRQFYTYEKPFVKKLSFRFAPCQ